MSHQLQISHSDSPETWVDAAGPGIANRGFKELKLAHFRCEAPGEWNLFIDQAPIPREQVNGRPTWKWIPGFHAGTVQAELHKLGETYCSRHLLDVSPDPSKLGQDLFLEMLEEVQEFDIRMLVGNEPAALSIGQNCANPNPAIQLARLLRYGQPFLAALHAIESAPQRSTRQSRMLVKPGSLRRADAQTIRASITSGSCLTLNSDFVEHKAAVVAQPFFDAPVSESTLDNAANRTLLAIVRKVTAYAQWIVTSFEETVRNEVLDAMHTPLQDRWPRRKVLIERFVDGMSRFRKREPLQSVSRAELSAEGLTSMSANPRYARARQLAWSILRPGFLGPFKEESTWMSPTWHVYEAWCMVRLCAALRSGLPDLSWGVVPNGEKSFSLVSNENGCRLSLSYQPRFQHPSGSVGGQGFSSISDTFIPDMVLSMERGPSNKWFIFDAKYSSSSMSILRQMRSAHIYHDALRYRGNRATACLLMVPSGNSEVEWLNEISFQDDHGVGVVPFSPGSGFEERVIGFVKDFLM